MNRNEFKQAMSGVQSSEQTLERIMDMTNKNTKKRIKFAPAIALVACLAILITGIFGGSAISAKLNPVTELYTITAYASDKKIDLKENEAIKTKIRLKLYKYGKDDYCAKFNGNNEAIFSISGREIESVSYYCSAGSFSYSTNISTETKEEYPNGGYGMKITFLNLKDNETAKVGYNPEAAEDALLYSKNLNYDYTTLPKDTIVAEIKFKDGTISKQEINLSFDKNGYVLMEYVK